MRDSLIYEIAAESQKYVSGIKPAYRETEKLERAQGSLGATFGKTGAASRGLADSYVTLKTAASALIASEVGSFLLNAGRAALDAQKATAILESSVGAARREFGDVVGSTEEWKRTLQGLRSELSIYSEKDLTLAIERTVTMTKRLGLEKDQMEEVIRRSADLAVGKTDLTGAVERVTAALRGEAESSELLGLTLNENFVKARSLEFGLKKGMFEALDDVSKAQIRYLVFLEQTNEAQGRAQEATDNHAGDIERLTVKYEEAKVSLGEYLLKLGEFSGFFDALGGDFGSAALKFINPFDLFASPKGSVTGSGESVVFGAAGDEENERLERFNTLVQQTINRLNTLGKTKGGSKGTLSLLEQEKKRSQELNKTLKELTGARLAEITALQKQNQASEQSIAGRLLDFPSLDKSTANLNNSVREATEQARDAFEEFQEEQDKAFAESVDKITSETEHYIFNVERRREVEKKAHDERIQELDQARQASEVFLGGFAELSRTAFEASGEHTKSFFTLYKGFAIAEAIANTYLGATKALAQGGIFGAAMAAGVIASGLAMVAKIASTNPGSSTGGGSPSLATKPSSFFGSDRLSSTASAGRLGGIRPGVQAQNPALAISPASGLNIRVQVEGQLTARRGSFDAEVRGKNSRDERNRVIF